MAHYLEDPLLDELAREVATLSGASTVDAIRHALQERKAKLLAGTRPVRRSQLAAEVLAEFRSALPPELRRKRLTREEEDEILGFGPGGA